jgi:hypothetical protein
MYCHVTTLLRWLPKTALLAVFSFLSAAGAEAGEQLSGRELYRLFPGRFQAVVQGTLVVSITARRDGSLLAEFMSRADTGHWSIRSGQLCIRLSKWRDGRISCSTVVEEAGWYRSNDVVFREADGIALARPIARTR